MIIRSFLLAWICCFLVSCRWEYLQGVPISWKDAVYSSGVFEIVVLPHHGITGKKIDEFYQSLKTTHGLFDTIVIVSPDHFWLSKYKVESLPLWVRQMCYGTSCVLSETLLPYGTNSEIGRIFSASGITREHGIWEHIIRISKYFPSAKVMPVLLRRKLVPWMEEYSIANRIASLEDSRILVVTSVDFSHHVREEFARLHDIKSVEILNQGTLEDFSDIEVDCRNCLAVAKLLSEKKKKTNFILFDRTSVDSISLSWAGINNTSHVFGSFQIPKKTFLATLLQVSDETSKVITYISSQSSTGVFLFMGDSHWTRGFLYYDKKINGYSGKVTSILYQQYIPTNHLSVQYHRIFSWVDDVIINFESALSREKNCPDSGKEIQLSTNQKYLPWFRDLGITMVNIANNHSHDCGKKIFEESYDQFASQEISAFWYNYFVMRSIRGNTYVFLWIDTIEAHFDLENTKKQLITFTASGYIPIVNIHWGVEYKTWHNLRQETIAHELIDAWARLIIWHHPHVVQEKEIYKWIPIYYSLGNFLFDQPFPETLEWLIVGCEVSTNITRCSDVSVYRDKKDFSLSFTPAEAE